MGFDLGEFVLHVVRIHGLDLFPGGRAQHFDDLDQLINPTLTWEQGLTEHQLGHNASRRPNI